METRGWKLEDGRTANEQDEAARCVFPKHFCRYKLRIVATHYAGPIS